MGTCPSTNCPKPEFNQNTCKDFIKPDPVYNQETCKAFISSPKFGLNYSPVNDESKLVIDQFQGIMNQLQPILCSAVGEEIIKEINNLDMTIVETDPTLLKKMMADQINQSSEMLNDYTLSTSIINLVNMCIDLSTVNGKVDVSKSKKLMLDIVKSVCPGVSQSKSSFGNGSSFGDIFNILFFVFMILLIVYLYNIGKIPWLTNLLQKK
jgi:hypothetical protein